MIDYLFNNPKGIKLAILNRVFLYKLPFNRPHKISILEYTKEQRTRALLPNIKKNHNHLGTIHACALACAGEFVSGLYLMGTVNPKKYRIIMSQLEAEYLFRAQSNIISVCDINDNPEIEIQDSSQYTRTLHSQLYNSDNVLVATVKTKWQIKLWEKINI